MDGSAAEQVAYLASDRYLEIILFPTEQCNFRCRYCYEDYALRKMRPEVVEGVKRLIAARIDGLDVLRLSWFGGEPLTALDIVCDIAAAAQGLAGSAGVDYSSSMTTNGYLLDLEAARRLAGLGLRGYQITLDGPPESHDRVRTLAGGGATFERIWGNLVALSDSELAFDILLRVHVSPDNIDLLPAFMDRVDRTFGDDSRFRHHLQAVGRWGGRNDQSYDVIGDAEEARLADLKARTARASSVPTRQAPEICYAARGNSFAVRADGAIAKCTVALSDERNTVGRLEADGTMRLDMGRLSPWLKGIKTLSPSYLRCPLGELSGFDA